MQFHRIQMNLFCTRASCYVEAKVATKSLLEEFDDYNLKEQQNVRSRVLRLLSSPCAGDSTDCDSLAQETQIIAVIPGVGWAIKKRRKILV